MPADSSGVMSSAWTQRGHRLIDLPALGVRAGDVDEHPGPPLGRQPGRVDVAAARSARPASPSSTATAISHSAHVGRPELGVVVVAPRPEPAGHGPALSR